MRLWLKLALAMVAVSLAPLVVVSVQFIDVTTDQAAEASQQARTRDATAVAEEVARWVELKSQAVHGWAGLYPDVLTRPTAVQDGLLKAVYRAVPGAVTVALLDQDGLAGPPGQELQPRWLDASLSEDDPLAQRPRGSHVRARALLDRAPRPNAPGRVWVSQPYVAPPASPGAPEPGPSLAIGARGPFAEPAILAVELDLEELERILARHAEGGRGVQLVVQGEVVLDEGPGVQVRDLAPLLGTGLPASFDAGGRLGALSPVPGLPWTIVTSEPITADSGLRTLAYRLGLALGLSIAVAVLAGLLVARTISRPIKRLRDAAHRIADGQLEHRVHADTGDEVGELAASFNHMAGRLSGTLSELDARRAEVEAFNEELQDRVEARTRDLEAAQSELLRAGQLAAVGEVGAGLAHELNNPLASVLGLLQVARATTSGSEASLLAEAEAEAQRCREVVAAMMQLSASDLGETEGQASLVATLREVVMLVEGAARARRVRIVASLGEAEHRVMLGEPDLRRALTQVLQGLVAGLSEGAQLEITLETSPFDAVSVVLRPSEAVAAGARRDDYRAAGLGLWVARRLIASAGGRLREPDGEGAWRLDLPRA